MIEVFKTDVTDAQDAKVILKHIHNRFVLYEANFDLDDCDHILRVKSILGKVESNLLIQVLGKLGFKAVVLQDELPAHEHERELEGHPFNGLESRISQINI